MRWKWNVLPPPPYPLKRWEKRGREVGNGEKWEKRKRWESGGEIGHLLNNSTFICLKIGKFTKIIIFKKNICSETISQNKAVNFTVWLTLSVTSGVLTPLHVWLTPSVASAVLMPLCSGINTTDTTSIGDVSSTDVTDGANTTDATGVRGT